MEERILYFDIVNVNGFIEANNHIQKKNKA